MRYVAFCAKGLEEVVLDEVEEVVGRESVVETGAKRIVFESDLDVDSLVKFRTVDDLGLLVDVFETDGSLEDIARGVSGLDFTEVRELVSECRGLNVDDCSFSLTIGVNSENDYKYDELESALVEGISSRFGWRYEERNRENFDIRVFVDGGKVYVSVRATRDSLHHRDYKKYSKPGSLKPTVAAAMVRIAAGDRGGLRLVDNCCGSGTILCEAHELGHDVYGGDLDAESVEISRRNLRNLAVADVEDRVLVLDCTKTPWQDNFFDIIVTNLPFGKQVRVESHMQLYRGCVEECVRISKTGGRMCFLTTRHEILVKQIKEVLPDAAISTQMISLMGQHPAIITVDRGLES